MKRVYAIFETRYEGDGPFINEDYFEGRWYSDKFLEVYDNFPAAIKSVRDWADSQEDCVRRMSNNSSEEVTIIDKTSPYSVNEDKIFIRREVKSRLLRSS